MKTSLFLSVLSTLACSIAYLSSAEAKYVPDVIAKKTLQDVALSTLEYSFKDQAETSDRIYLAGEFRTKIQSTLVPALVGVGKTFSQDDEASAFTTGAVVNVLAPIYLKYPDLQNHSTFKKIPFVISKAVNTYSRFC